MTALQTCEYNTNVSRYGIDCTWFQSARKLGKIYLVYRMPWQGNEDNLIDRFDVRAHLDWIPEASDTIDVDIALTSEDRHINYERYRIIVQNEFLGGTLFCLYCLNNNFLTIFCL